MTQTRVAELKAKKHPRKRGGKDPGKGVIDHYSCSRYGISREREKGGLGSIRENTSSSVLTRALAGATSYLSITCKMHLPRKCKAGVGIV